MILYYVRDPLERADWYRMGEAPKRSHGRGLQGCSMAIAKKADSAAIVVDAIQTEVLQLHILGTTPLILNRISEKARHEFVLPSGGRKTAADRAASLKHDPIEEFRASPYIIDDDDAPTLLAHMASAFKGAAMTASLDLPGTRKAQIGRLLWVRSQLVGIYGIPEVFSAIVRMADINKTPDVKTRAIVPRWAATIVVEFAVPLLTTRSVVNLFSAAGVIAGIGDWRPEKGKGNYGQFTLVDPDNESFVEITQTGGRAAQVAAMDNPFAYDRETEELLSWFETEVQARGKRRAA